MPTRVNFNYLLKCTMLHLCFFVVIFSFILNGVFAAEKSSNMVFIPKGSYIPLFKFDEDVSDDRIFVDSFFIDKYPITNYEFKTFILNNLKWSVDNVSEIFVDRGYLSHWHDFDFETIKNYPVVNVSWFAANAYCSDIGARLPYIDEWEYVASSSQDNPIGKDDPGYLQDVLDWYLNSQAKSLIDVEFMQKNYWGVFGMHGVIWELVKDFNSVILLNTDSEGGGLEEVLYCGATATNAIDPADYVAFMRFAFRNSLEANYTMSHLGFRCVKDVKDVKDVKKD